MFCLHALLPLSSVTVPAQYAHVLVLLVSLVAVLVFFYLCILLPVVLYSRIVMLALPDLPSLHFLLHVVTSIHSALLAQLDFPIQRFLFTSSRVAYCLHYLIFPTATCTYRSRPWEYVSDFPTKLGGALIIMYHRCLDLICHRSTSFSHLVP